MSWAVNTCLGIIVSDIESTSLLCWPSGAGARHRRRMSSQVCSLYRCESGWSKRVLDIQTIWITYSSYRYGPWRIVILPTSVKIWRSLNDPALGAERPRNWGGTTAFGADVGRIDPGRIDSGVDRA